MDRVVYLLELPELIVLIRLLLTPIFNRSFNFFTLEISEKYLLVNRLLQMFFFLHDFNKIIIGQTEKTITITDSHKHKGQIAVMSTF